MWLGLAAMRLGDFKSARLEGEKSLAMKRQNDMDAELARSFNALGLLAWQEGRLRDALQHFDSAKASAARNRDQPGIARALSNIPLVQVELGDFDLARKGFLAALVAGKELDDHRIQGNALANLAMVEIRLGNATRAVSLLSEARTHYRAIEYGTGESNALGQLATAWSQLGDLQQAIAAADSALAIARGAGLQQEVAAELEVLADLQVQAGSPRLALRRLAEADSIDAALGLHVERGTNLRRVAAILTDLGEYPAAIAKTREAVAIHREAEARAEEIYDRLQLAHSLSLNNQPAAARAEADSAARHAGPTGNPSIVRAVAWVAARLALDAKDPKRALTILARVGPIATPTDWKVADLRAEALLAIGRLDEARAEGERAITALERERGSLGTGPLRSVYLASRSSPFSNLVAIHLARRDTAAAFAVAASLPGRSLSERLGGFVDAPRSLAALADGERLLLRAAMLEDTLSELGREARDVERRTGLERQLATVRTAYEQQLAQRAALPDAPMLGLAPVTLSQVQSQLLDDEALLAFLSGPRRLDLFVVRRGLSGHVSIPIGDRALAQRVRLARELLARPRHAPELPSGLADLFDLLLGHTMRDGSFAGVNRVLIVPHGSLGGLPFGALWNRRNGKFLIEEQVVSYLPAVSALGVQHRDLKAVRRLMVFAPLPTSLPGTRAEARGVARMAPGTTVRMGASSTEPAVRSALLAGHSIHVASHGTHNAQNPLFSRMIVGDARGGVATDDGRLEVHEILGLQTTSPLVFLSGCETGLGLGSDSPFEQGSEEGSLAQAFLIAGARNVVATLWRVPDASTAKLAESFYRELGSASTPDEALAGAQREAIRRQADYTWSAYIQYGNSMRKSLMAVRKTDVEP
jgi:CHAT domain-containing protein